MPRISFFGGIVILMFSNEGHHAVAHFHARYAEHRAEQVLQQSGHHGRGPEQHVRRRLRASGGIGC